MFYDNANRAAGKHYFRFILCLISALKHCMDMYVNTHGEFGLLVIFNQPEVEQLVPDFKKYKMDSMLILLPH